MKKELGKKTIVTPLPVLIVATYDEDGIPNAMNVAWGGQVGNDKISISIGRHKTTDNIKLKKAFTVSFADRGNLLVADYFGVESGYNADKIEKAGVTVSKSAHVDAPVIDDFPLTLECQVVDIQEEYNETRIVGEVVNTLADESILDDDGNVDLGKLQPIMFDSAANCYRIIGGIVGKAFYDGKQLK